jgi:hypothetical protein
MSINITTPDLSTTAMILSHHQVKSIKPTKDLLPPFDKLSDIDESSLSPNTNRESEKPSFSSLKICKHPVKSRVAMNVAWGEISNFGYTS